MHRKGRTGVGAALRRSTSGSGERPGESVDPWLISSAFETMGYGLIVIDEHGIICSANAMARRNFGYESASLVGTEISIVLPGISYDDFGRFLERHRRTGADQAGIGAGFEIDGVRRDGSTFAAHVDLREFSHGRSTYYLCACRDATGERDHSNLLAHLSRHDRATGCLNLFGLEDYLDQAIEWSPDQQLALVYVDFDGLSGVSDSYPRAADALLVAQAAGHLRAALREQDRLARLGRSEFVAVIPRDQVDPDVRAVARLLEESLKLPLEAAVWSVPARARIGVSLYPEHGSTPETLVERAKAAMQRGRRAETSQAQIYSREDQGYDEEQLEFYRRLQAALDRDEFTLHYQPQFDLTTLETTGLEALIRWKHPDGGLIPPQEFLPLLAACGLMPAVTRWVLREAIAANVGLIRDGIIDVPVGVNVSPEDFEDPGFVDLISDVLAEHGLPPNRLEVEVTEATAIIDPSQVAANAQALHDLGVGVAIDDFGTGFSSLKRLRLTRFSKLKIDRAFVAALPGDGNDQAVITALLDLADGLTMDAVAEGIESKVQLVNLRRLGCRFGQGFWYAKPLSEEELRSWVRTSR